MALFLFLRRFLSVAYLITHPAVPKRLKALPALAFVYLIFPRDLIFDFRAFGYFEDVIVVTLLLGIFSARAWRYVGNDKKRKSDAIVVDYEVLDRADGSTPNGTGADGTSEPAPDDAADVDADGAPRSDIRG
jgi:uncharacterized membrane protein YkvA (DUF1232 family)